jgi:hypothetical protein
LTRKYAAVLGYPAWSDQELAVLTGFLREYVGAGQTVRDAVLHRLRF